MTSSEQPYEVERKFLVINDEWRKDAEKLPIIQGYLMADRIRSVRVRIVGEKAVLGIKGPLTPDGRLEYEYDIPRHHAKHMLDELSQGPLIEKTRHYVPYRGHTWEIDEFHGASRGLVVAEVELDTPEEDLELPSWIGPEVTGEPRFYNTNLAEKPFTTWGVSYEQLLVEHGESA